MANHMNCPECEHPFGYSVALIGKTIRCRQCQHTFTVKAPPADASSPGSKPAAPAVGSAKQAAPKPGTDTATPPPMPAKVLDNRDDVRRTKNREEEDKRQREKDERERQRKADNRRTSNRDDDDDDRPSARRDDDRDRGRPPARSNRYEDDDDDRPSDRRERGSDKGTLIGILIGTGVFVALIIGVLGYVLWPKGKKDETSLVVTNPPPNNNPVGENVNAWPGIPNIPNPPPFNPPVRPNPPPVRPNPPPIFDPPPVMDPLTPKKPPAVAPQAKPNGLSAREEIELGGPLESIVVGAGGKYLCVSVPLKEKVVIFDTETLKIAKEITVAGSVKLAAGKDMLHILNPNALTMERYKLGGTFERDASHKFPIARNVFAMAMGSDSDGPLVLVGLDNTIFKGGMLSYFEAKTYRDIGVRVTGSKGPAFGIGNKDQPPIVFVSNDGKVVMAHGMNHSEPVIDIFDGMRGVVRNSPPFGFRDFVKPIGNGSTLLGKGCFYNTEFKTNDKPKDGTWLIPAMDGDYYMSLTKPTRDFGRDEGQPMFADIWHMGSKTPMLGIGVFPEFVYKWDFDHRRPEGFHNNVFLSAKAKTLTLIAPDDNTRLVTYKVKLD